ncbi:MAG: LpxI family protein [Planctomycetes bacterium]|nr:LpxI family protein [Planctomycetota bacterium]
MSEIGTTIGLIAGAGRAPVLAAQGIKSRGHRLAVVALEDLASAEIKPLADVYRRAGLARPGAWIRALRAAGVKQAVLIGSARKADMYDRWRLLRFLPDWRAIKIWYFRIRKDRRDKALLLAVADELASEGIELVSSVEYCTEHLASEGLMTRTAPSAAAAGDIEFGWRIARACADNDIGQAIAVRERNIIAVEAVEGTDAMIRRAGELCRPGGWTMIKVARPNQDMRFDVPTIGPETIGNLKAARCGCLVVQAAKLLIIDKPQTLELADRLGIAVVGKTP